MRPRCRVFIATSLDGFIARPDGRIDWLEAAQRRAAVPAGEDFGYADFIAGIDAVVMGRLSFEQVLGFDPWPYERPVIVMSRRGVEVPHELADRVGVSDEAPAALVERLGASGLRALYIDGGQTIRAFLAEGLIDEMTVTTVPVLIGEGRPLFGPLAADRPWTLSASRAWPCGYVQSTYVPATD